MQDLEVPVKIKLAALWTSVMFCYIYADYFGLYIPGALQKMLQGKMGPLGPTTQGSPVRHVGHDGDSQRHIFLSVGLKARLNRWLNVIFGVLYTVIILITMWSWAFYIFFGVIEVTLTMLVVWYAWRWPESR